MKLRIEISLLETRWNDLDPPSVSEFDIEKLFREEDEHYENIIPTTRNDFIRADWKEKFNYTLTNISNIFIYFAVSFVTTEFKHLTKFTIFSNEFYWISIGVVLSFTFHGAGLSRLKTNAYEITKNIDNFLQRDFVIFLRKMFIMFQIILPEILRKQDKSGMLKKMMR